MRIIDCHTHIYPDTIAKRGTESICEFYDLKSDMTGSANVLLDEGKKAGIEKFLLLPVAVNEKHVRQINEFTRRQINEHPEFFGFATVHPNMEDMLGEVEYAFDMLSLRGIKIHPDTQRFSIDDKRLYPLYDALQEKGMPILIHTGDFRYEYSRPEKLKKILHEFPHLTVIAAHLGGWSLFDVAYENLKDENCYLDISSSMMFISLEEVAGYVHGYGADRVLFGTDFPLWKPEKEVESFMKLDLTDDEREKIAYRNAEKLFGI